MTAAEIDLAQQAYVAAFKNLASEAGAAVEGAQDV